MCPACIATAALVVAGATSAGGLIALVVKKRSAKTGARGATRHPGPWRSTNRRMDMLRENNNAVIYGAGGAIGGAVARAFAREGATVFLAGRTLAAIDAVAKEISAAGGEARRLKWTLSTSRPSRITSAPWLRRGAPSTRACGRPFRARDRRRRRQ